MEPTGLPDSVRSKTSQYNVMGILLIDNFRATTASFVLYWRLHIWGARNVIILFSNVPHLVAIGWIASTSGDSTVLSYIYFGSLLYPIWNLGTFRLAWFVVAEVLEQTFDPVLVSRTPLMLDMLGKALAILSATAVQAPIAIFTIWAVSQRLPEVGSYPLLLASLLIAMFSVFSVSFLFAPFHTLTGGRVGVLNAIWPLGIVVSGFLYPITELPLGLQVIARLLPTSWGMEGIKESIEYAGNAGMILRQWSITLGISLLYFAATAGMFLFAERRVRLTGSLEGN